MLTYDSLWLRPDAALLSDSLSLLHMDAESAGMVPAGTRRRLAGTVPHPPPACLPAFRCCTHTRWLPS